ncbi:MAG: S8 family serine peptidase [Polyangiaceae bacterium]
MKRALCSLLCVGALFGAARASAQVDLGRLGRSLSAQRKFSARPLPLLFARGRAGGVPLIVRAPAGELNEPGFVTVGDFAVGQLEPGRFSELSQAHPDWIFDWAPPRHALLDRIEGWVHAASVRKATQTSGKGVVVGIVDTGLELTHRDFRTADGSTRVAWLLDVSRAAAGKQPALETSYGCTVKPGCAVFSAADLDALLANNTTGDEPNDPFGHGTHVASLAAGNGLSSPTPRYIGVAPEATYVVARVAQSDGGILDADVLRAVTFVFERAEELGMPAVVNLSLGSDFGAHDGSSGLEQGLSSMVGATFPGRAIVVAAGNSAGLYGGDLSSTYPAPFGIHTEVHVPRDSVSRVPLITPAISGNTVNGTAYVWVGFRPGDDVSVALEDKTGTRIAAVPVGHGSDFDDGKLRVTLLNGTTSDGPTNSVSPGSYGAVLSIDGTWPADSNFTIVFEGHGTAQLWVQGEGDLNPELGLGALFPRAEKEGTINVPASASGLIAVGATLNRTNWVDVEGNAVDLPNVGSLDNTPLDTIAYFSAAGPNALGMLKPDIVAPGVFVAGAMARSVDPRNVSGGLFGSQGRCPAEDDCFVVDETHAITSGTSMSSPIVAGAIALLFERDPTLTQDAVRAILQAGARTLKGIVIDPRQIGPGALDLEGALAVATAGDSPALRTPSDQSWLTLSASFAHPDPTWPLTGYLDLRDDAGQLADGFDASRLRLETRTAVVEEDLTRVAPGFYRFAVTAPDDAGGQTMTLRVFFDQQLIAAKELPIAVDRWLASDGVSARGGCAAHGSRAPNSAAGALCVALALLALRRRHMRAK